MSLHREEKQPKAMDTSIKVAFIGAAATLVAAVITAYISRQQQPPAAQEKRSQPAPAPLPFVPRQQQPPAAQEKRSQVTLDQVLDILQHHRQRATFGAVAEVLGREPRNLFDGYPRTPRTAWVVSKGTGQPTGYKQSELPPGFFTNAHVITNKEELIRWIEQKK